MATARAEGGGVSQARVTRMRPTPCKRALDRPVLQRRAAAGGGGRRGVACDVLPCSMIVSNRPLPLPIAVVVLSDIVLQFRRESQVLICEAWQTACLQQKMAHFQFATTPPGLCGGVRATRCVSCQLSSPQPGVPPFDKHDPCIYDTPRGGRRPGTPREWLFAPNWAPCATRFIARRTSPTVAVLSCAELSGQPTARAG